MSVVFVILTVSGRQNVVLFNENAGTARGLTHIVLIVSSVHKLAGLALFPEYNFIEYIPGVVKVTYIEELPLRTGGVPKLLIEFHPVEGVISQELFAAISFRL